MSTAVVEPKKWRKRLWRLTITSTLMGTSFAVGVAITAYIAVRLLFPIAAVGMTMGMVGMASASAHATTSALYSGDSATRLAILTQLQQTIDAQPTMTFDDQTSAWILPAIEQCKTDKDPEVVSLAEELAKNIKDRTLPPPQWVAEQSDAPKSANGAFFQWRDHRADLVIRNVLYFSGSPRKSK